MSWNIAFKSKANKSLQQLDNTIQIRIVDFLNKLALQDNPRLQGKALTGEYAGLWRYRVGDYRIICNIQDNQLTILVLQLGHRKNIY
ncbi:MAG: type II toxin-antitoxin system RelE/ParE family toxin [Methylococcales bacterium]|nr:type II toxin-antitoxin system RelE/ParE family toxin [Methylococcales bacterium]